MVFQLCGSVLIFWPDISQKGKGRRLTSEQKTLTLPGPLSPANTKLQVSIHFALYPLRILTAYLALAVILPHGSRFSLPLRRCVGSVHHRWSQASGFPSFLFVQLLLSSLHLASFLPDLLPEARFSQTDWEEVLWHWFHWGVLFYFEAKVAWSRNGSQKGRWRYAYVGFIFLTLLAGVLEVPIAF